MTPESLKALRLKIQESPSNGINTISDFAAALGYTGDYGKRTVQRLEAGDTPIKGPVLVLLREWARTGKPAPRSDA